MTTATEVAAGKVHVRAAPIDITRLGRNAGAAALAALPGILTIYLSFNTGGFFAGAQGAVVAVLAGTVAVRMAVVRDPFAGFSRPLRIAIATLAFYSLWSLLSSRWSHSPARALLDFDLVNVYLFTLILFGSSARSHRRVHWTVVITWLSMLGVCVVSLATRLRPDLFPLPVGMAPNRLSFPLTYWNALGQFAVIGIILAFHLGSSTRESRLLRVLGTAAVPVFSVTILLTFSRAALVLGGGGLLAYALLARPRGLLPALVAAGPASVLAVLETYQAKLIANAQISTATWQEGRHLTTTILLACLAAGLVRFALLEADTRLANFTVSSATRHNARIVLGFVCMATVLVAVFGFSGEIAHQWDKFTRSAPATANVESRINSFSFDSRLPVWKIALAVFDRDPLHGHGAGTYPVDYDQRRTTVDVALNPHSLYLEAMSELGVVGLAAIVITVLVLIGACFMRARRSARSLWTALGVVGLVWAVHAGVDWDWEMPAVTLPVVALTACALARRGGGSRLRPQTELVLRVAVGLLAIVVAATAVRISLSDSHLNTSVTDFQEGNCQGAVRAADATIAVLASRPQPYAVIGYCEVHSARPKPAVNRMSEAVLRDPQNWRYYYGLAIARAAAGLDPRPALRRAELLDPLEPMIHAAASAFSAHNRRRWHQAALGLEMPVTMGE